MFQVCSVGAGIRADTWISQLVWVQGGEYHWCWLLSRHGPFCGRPQQGCCNLVLNEGRSHFDRFLLNNSVNGAQAIVWHKLREWKKCDLHIVGTSVVIRIRRNNWIKIISGKRKQHMSRIVLGDCFYAKRGYNLSLITMMCHTNSGQPGRLHISPLIIPVALDFPPAWYVFHTQLSLGVDIFF